MNRLDPNLVSINVTTPLVVSGHDHDPVIVALLYLPIAIFMVMLAIEAGHQAGVGVAVRMRAGYGTLSTATNGGLLLVATCAWIHLALTPVHWAEDPLRAVLFLGDGLGLGAIALLALAQVRAWRPVAILLLGGSIFAYAFYVLTGREGVDPVGIFTTAVEFAAIVLVLAGQRAETSSIPSIPGEARTSKTSEVIVR